MDHISKPMGKVINNIVAKSADGLGKLEGEIMTAGRLLTIIREIMVQTPGFTEEEFMGIAKIVAGAIQRMEREAKSNEG